MTDRNGRARYTRRSVLVSSCLLMWPSVLLAAERPPVFEVQNGKGERFREAVRVTLPHKQAKRLDGQAMVEIGPDGDVVEAVQHSVDSTDPEGAVLSWLPGGITSPGVRRRYTFVPKEQLSAPPPATSDLKLTETPTHLVVSNSYFGARHPRVGGGGFPCWRARRWVSSLR